MMITALQRIFSSPSSSPIPFLVKEMSTANRPLFSVLSYSARSLLSGRRRLRGVVDAPPGAMMPPPPPSVGSIRPCVLPPPYLPMYGNFNSWASKTMSCLSSSVRQQQVPRPVLLLHGPSSLLVQARHKHTLKTNKSVSKRFKARGDGTLVRMKSGKSHNTGDKPRARKNRLGQSTTIAEPKVEKKIQRVMPY